MPVPRKIDKKKNFSSTDIAKPSARSRQGDAVARVKTQAAAHRKRITESKSSPTSKERMLAGAKTRTESRVASAAATTYTRPEGTGPKFRKRTPAERAAEKARVAARKKKRLQG